MEQNVDFDGFEKLFEALGNAVRAHLPLPDGEIITACSYTLANAVANIQCPGCREVARKDLIERFLPKLFAEAMKANHASVSDCVH